MFSKKILIVPLIAVMLFCNSIQAQEDNISPYQKGIELENNNKLKSAIAQYDLVINNPKTLKKERIQALHRKADCLKKLNQFNKAKETYKRIISLAKEGDPIVKTARTQIEELDKQIQAPINPKVKDNTKKPIQKTKPPRAKWNIRHSIKKDANTIKGQSKYLEISCQKPIVENIEILYYFTIETSPTAIHLKYFIKEKIEKTAYQINFDIFNDKITLVVKDEKEKTLFTKTKSTGKFNLTDNAKIGFQKIGSDIKINFNLHEFLIPAEAKIFKTPFYISGANIGPELNTGKTGISYCKIRSTSEKGKHKSTFIVTYKKDEIKITVQEGDSKIIHEKASPKGQTVNNDLPKPEDFDSPRDSIEKFTREYSGGNGVSVSYNMDDNLAMTNENEVDDSYIHGNVNYLGTLYFFTYNLDLGVIDYTDEEEEDYNYQNIGTSIEMVFGSINWEYNRISDSSNFNTERVGFHKNTFMVEAGFPIFRARYVREISRGESKFNGDRYSLSFLPSLFDTLGVNTEIGYADRTYKGDGQRNFHGLFMHFGNSNIDVFGSGITANTGIYVGPQNDSFENIGVKRLYQLKGGFDFPIYDFWSIDLGFGIQSEEYRRGLNNTGSERKDLEMYFQVKTTIRYKFSKKTNLEGSIAYKFIKQDSNIDLYEAEKNLVTIEIGLKF